MGMVAQATKLANIIINIRHLFVLLCRHLDGKTGLGRVKRPGCRDGYEVEHKKKKMTAGRYAPPSVGYEFIDPREL